MDAPKPERNDVPPFHLISIGLATTVLLVLLVGLAVWRSYALNEEERREALAVEQILTRAETYGTSATRYRQSAIATGDRRWSEAYEIYVRELEATLAQAAEFSSRDGMRSAARRADSLNHLIAATERRAIDAALAGNLDEARMMVEEPSFNGLIHKYTVALLQFSKASNLSAVLADLRFHLTSVEREVALIERAIRAGANLPEHVQASARLFERRVSATVAQLDVDRDLSPYTDRLSVSVASLLSATPADLDSALVAVQEARADLIQQIESLDAAHRAVTARRSWILPLLLTLILVFLLLAWTVITRLLRRGIREREQARARLRESELENEALIRALPDLFFIHDEKGTYLDYRAAPENLLVPPSEFVGRTVADTHSAEVNRQAMAAIGNALATGDTQQFEYTLERGGRKEVFETRVVPMGEKRVVSIVRDITAQRHAEEASREAESRFRTLVESSLVGIYIIQDERFVYVNPRFEEIVGRTSEELIGCQVLDIILPEDRSLVRENLRRRIEGETDRIHYTVRSPHPDGSMVIGEVFGSITTINGHPAVIGTLLDVTERERSRREIHRLTAFYEETLNRLPVEIAVFDRDLRYLYLNPVAVEDVTLRARLIGRHMTEFRTAQSADDIVFERRMQWLETTVISASVQTMEEEVTMADGRRADIMRVATPVLDADGQVQHIVTYGLDISDRKEYERHLLDARDRAEELVRLKSTFLANMSHEVRTPLTGILGFAAVLEEEVPEEQRQFAALIRKSGKRLLETLNAILDLSRIEAGEMRLHIHPIDLVRETAEITSFLRPLASEKRIDFTVSLPETTLVSPVDIRALHIILNNLIGNAIKFTERGLVNVKVEQEGGTNVIRVRDTGVGIDDAFLPQLFEEFKQESAGLDRTHEGAGLGLAITQRLVLMMDGNITVESRKGKGSVFTVSFPSSKQLDLPLFEGAEKPDSDLVQL
ncbi:MAG: PAS domain S-box protein [Bacteroidota bacterium]